MNRLSRTPLSVILIGALVFAVACAPPGARMSRLRFEVSFPAAVQEGPLDGRVLLLISKNFEDEPRFTTVTWRDTQPFFGLDVEGMKPGQAAVIDEKTLGFPLESILDIPAGEYNVQAALNVYTTFQRSDGRTVKMHMDQWEGQQWNRSPGNLYSKPQRVKIDPAAGGVVGINLTEKMPPIDPPKDTRYVKHLKIRSELVSRFWGRDMFLGAVILLPAGFDSHADAHYPVAYLQGHFTPSLRGFREEPPDPGAAGDAKASQEAGYRFFQEWTSERFPRFLVVIPQDPNPYYDDSYAVNSANVGPYGDALARELIPYVEKEFRGVGEPWARTLFGGSTGGWRALAVQVLNPDLYNGTWVFCPDPVDFRYFQLVNIYDDENAYYPRSDWRKSPVRPWMRDVDDQVLMSQREASIFELVLGTRGRSGQQMDIFQAVYGPVGDDGYPRLLYDKLSGAIDKEVAAYWRERYDLRHIMERDWADLGPKLKGKLHVYMGDNDTFYLEEATMLLEKFLRGTQNPYFEGTVEYGKRAPHCWTGCPPGTNPAIYYIPAMAEHITKTAPAGADLRSWRY
jgi:hypothetical protein